MNKDDNNIESCRQYRKTINMIADYIIANENAVIEFGNSLEWSDLENIPEWLLWENNAIKQLVMIAGTIYFLPSIRIWIDSKKIQEVRKLIGESVFDYILHNTMVDNNQVSSLNITNVADNILSAGSAVIISCHSLRLRPWLIRTIPKPKAKLDKILAEIIMRHALSVIDQTKNELTRIEGH
jgi:hypothetical protein